MKLMWTGSDVLFQKQFPPYIGWKFKIKIFVQRLAVKIIEPFLEGHQCASFGLKVELTNLGFSNVEIKPDPAKFTKMPKVEHKGFNVLYYLPVRKNQKWCDYLYGYDIVLELIKNFQGMRDVRFIRLDGTKNMSKFYPIADMYIRPNRHDGCPRIIMECEIQDIPYYATEENPKLKDFKKEILHTRGER